MTSVTVLYGARMYTALLELCADAAITACCFLTLQTPILLSGSRRLISWLGVRHIHCSSVLTWYTEELHTLPQDIQPEVL